MDKTVKILVIIFALVGIGLFAYHWTSQWHSKTLNQAITAEKAECLKKIAALEAEISRLHADMEAQSKALPTESELSSAFGDSQPGVEAVTETPDCSQVTRQIVAFFQYLDRKSYLIWPDVNMRAEQLFEEIFQRLAAKPPINVGEMENIASLVHNVAHFYRVLGKERIDLIKEIMNSESAVLEPAMSVMFTWLTACNPEQTVNKQQGPAAPSLKTLYQYAGFFLNTLGGRSYLLRREPRIRVLTNYYALLIIDRANDAKINAYGIDIRPHIDYVFYDLNNQKGLMYRERYLTRLNALQAKYQ